MDFPTYELKEIPVTDGFRMLRQQAKKPTAYPEAFVPNCQFRRTRYVALLIVRLQISGLTNYKRKRSMPIRLPNEADIFAVSCVLMIGSPSGEKLFL